MPLEPGRLSSRQRKVWPLSTATAVMTGIAALVFADARTLLRAANLAAAMTMEALRARLEPFDERIHDLRRHAGQGAVARDILSYVAGSKLIDTCDEVQDAYSIRCMPQVHGAVSDTIDFVENVLLNELNAVTDNPLLFPADGDVLSGGNFHGEPVALAMGLPRHCTVRAGKHQRTPYESSAQSRP